MSSILFPNARGNEAASVALSVPQPLALVSRISVLEKELCVINIVSESDMLCQHNDQEQNVRLQGKPRL